MTDQEKDTGQSRKKSGNASGKTGGKEGAGGKDKESPKVSPTGDMLTAHLLAMLNGWSAYGYELAQRLEESGLGQYNKGSIYRILRQMEDSGLVSSSWDTSKDGPARRIYDLTDTGSMFLKNWMVMADMHRNFLKSMLELNPLMSAMSAASGSRSRAEDDSDTESESNGEGDEA
jgi:PadR family transcriptional regulator PadR